MSDAFIMSSDDSNTHSLSHMCYQNDEVDRGFNYNLQNQSQNA